MYLRSQPNPILDPADGWPASERRPGTAAAPASYGSCSSDSWPTSDAWSPSDAHSPIVRLRVAEASPEWEAPEEPGPENGPDAVGEAAGEAEDQAARHRDAREMAAMDRAAGETARITIVPDGSAETEDPRMLELLVQAGLSAEVARVFLSIQPKPRVTGPWARFVEQAVPDVPLTAEQADAFEELTDAVRGLSAQIAAGEYRLMILVAAVDRSEAWRERGHRTCADWFASQTGMDLGAARQRVRTAAALVKLPRVGEAMARGALSYSKVRALGRLAEELESEEAQLRWIEVAQKLPAHELERRVSHARQLCVRDETELEQRRIERRSFSIRPDGEGMYRIEGRLLADEALLLEKALQMAVDAQYHADGREWSAKGDGRSVHIETIPLEQRLADAIHHLSLRVLEVGFATDEQIDAELAELEADTRNEGGNVSAETDGLRSSGDGVGDEECCGAEEGGERATRPAAPRVPRWAAQSTAERYRVIVRVDEAALRDGAGSLPGQEPSLRAETSYMDGTRVTPETARRLTCCSGVTRLICSDDLVKAMSTRSRRVPQRLWTALLVRDRGCRFPGCRCRINLVSHHIVHFADGGKTEYWNLILLCPVHHRGVHEGRFSVKLKRTGEALFEDRAGMPIPPCAPPPALRDPIQELRDRWLAESRAQGIDPATPRARGEVRSARDLPPGLMERAMGALGEGGAGDGVQGEGGEEVRGEAEARE